MRSSVQWARFLAGAASVLVAASILVAMSPHVIKINNANSLRLRVIANSNTPGDQHLKAEVRDAVLAVLGTGLTREPSARAATQYVRNDLPTIKKVAEAIVTHAHSSESVHVTLGAAPFPSKSLGSLRFPPGSYPALVVTLGAGRGHNWWTVLFPPLTFLAAGNRLLVVGPTGPPGSKLTPTQRQILLQWVSGHADATLDGDVVTVHTDGATAAVEIRFLLWQVVSRWWH